MRATPQNSAPAPAAAPPAPAPAAPRHDAVDDAVGHAVGQGKEWLQSIDVTQLAGQLPRSVRDLGTRVAGRVRALTPVQQAVGAAALAFGIGLLAVRRRRNERTADAKASKKYRAKFESKPFKGRGKFKFAAK